MSLSLALSQVKSFLPSLARANEELNEIIRKDGGMEKVNIETPQEPTARCIQLVSSAGLNGVLILIFFWVKMCAINNCDHILVK